MEKDSAVVTHDLLKVNHEQAANDEITSWLRLIRDRRWSRRQKHQLLKAFQTPNNIYQASCDDYAGVITGKKQKGVFDAVQFDENVLQQDYSWLEREGAACITYNSPLYPEQLRQIADPPLALFVLGNVSLLHEPQIAIVGSRRPTPIGSKLARQLAKDLSELGIVITSGLALGVDGLSHMGALDKSNPTIAVMGCGLDTVYPARHRELFDRVRQHGLLVSEYPVGVKPSKYTFPERNRIVSGLSIGVLIIEAAIRSGTMITARLAVEQNRELMVLPGSALSSQYEGSHSLLRDGAALVANSKDILFAIKNQLSLYDLKNDNENVKEREEIEGRVLSSDESLDVTRDKVGQGIESDSLLGFIGAEPVSVEELIMSSGLTPAKVSSMLLMLELEGRVAISDDGGYSNIG